LFFSSALDVVKGNVDSRTAIIKTKVVMRIDFSLAKAT
jgi:hypothetical protein